MVQVYLPIFSLISRDTDLVVKRSLTLWKSVGDTEITSSV